MFSSKSLLKGNLIGIRFIAENKKTTNRIVKLHRPWLKI